MHDTCVKATRNSLQDHKRLQQLVICMHALASIEDVEIAQHGIAYSVEMHPPEVMRRKR